MSDGPHRSLPLRKAWKELAKRGDQGTYDAEQVAEAAAGALASDFKNEIKWSLVDALKSIFTGRDNSLGLPEIALQELEDAKSLAAGSVFERTQLRGALSSSTKVDWFWMHFMKRLALQPRCVVSQTYGKLKSITFGSQPTAGGSCKRTTLWRNFQLLRGQIGRNACIS
jgi:hypothetical protein